MLVKTSSPRSARIDRLDVDERDGRRVVDELRELLDVLIREQVGPRREQLPELDVRRPELFERLTEVARALASGVAVPANADLREDAPNSAPPRDTGDVQRAPSTLYPCAHIDQDDPVGRGGNAAAASASIDQTVRPPPRVPAPGPRSGESTTSDRSAVYQ